MIRKRSGSPLPPSPGDSKKAKSELSSFQVPKWKVGTRSPTVELSRSTKYKPPTRGSEWLRLPPALGRDPLRADMNDLVILTTEQLAREGKRLIRAPRLLSDGISFDWVLDFSAKNEDTKSLMSVEGISSTSLRAVLQRGETRSAQRHGTSTIINILSDDDDDESKPTMLHVAGERGGNIANPIIIDVDDEDTSHTSNCNSDISTPPANDKRLSATCFPNACSPPPSSSGIPASRVTRPQSMMDFSAIREAYPAHPDESLRASTRAMTPSSNSNRQSSSKPFHVTPSPPISAANVKIPVTPEIRSTSDSALYLRQSQEAISSFHSNDSPRLASTSRLGSSVQSHLPKSAGIQDRNPLYGDWDMLAAESSETEADHGRSSTRESSPDYVPPAPSRTGDDILMLLTRSQLASRRSSEQSSRRTSPQSRNATKDSGSDSEGYRSASSVQLRRLTKRNDIGSDSDRDDDTRESPVSSARSAPLRRLAHHTRSGRSYRARITTPSDDESVGRRSRQTSFGRCSQLGDVFSDSDENDNVRHSLDHAERELVGPPIKRPSSSRHSMNGNDRPLRVEPRAAGRTVMVPKAEYARGRRLLTPSNPRLPLAAVVMRGDAQFINQREKSHISRYSLPAIDETRHVEDVCLMGDNTVVVGYNVGPSQVSLIPLFDDQLPRRIDLRYKAHSTVIESKSHPAQPNPGISCLASVPGPDLRFLSGGHDKTVHLWSVTLQDGNYTARSARIATKHSQPVHAVAYHAATNSVLSCAGPFIATTSLSAHSAPEPERVSGKIQQVHIHPHAPSLVVLEVDHMDRQVHFYDTRKGGFRHAPCLEFGHRTAARRAGTRYAKGSASNSLFARGYADGTVHVWDYRNGARKNVVERFQFERPAEVVHTVLCDSDVIAYGGYSVTFWSLHNA